jgi:RNA polymerase sigma-70 factor (ECF subfamily)
MSEEFGSDFEQFFRTHHPRLVAIALALTGDVDGARDAAQEALLRAYRDWAKVAALDSPAAWVRRVVVNVAIDAIRRRHRDHRLVGRLAGAPDTTELAGAEGSPTWAAVRELPDRERAAIVLRYVDDLPVAEIARVLGVTDGTIKTSLHRARTTLHQRLGEEAT